MLYMLSPSVYYNVIINYSIVLGDHMAVYDFTHYVYNESVVHLLFLTCCDYNII